MNKELEVGAGAVGGGGLVILLKTIAFLVVMLYYSNGLSRWCEE